MKIHLSEATKISLENDRDGRNFIVIPRGNIEVKVKYTYLAGQFKGEQK